MSFFSRFCVLSVPRADSCVVVAGADTNREGPVLLFRLFGHGRPVMRTGAVHKHLRQNQDELVDVGIETK
jgi:hypothetical protein